MHSERARPRLPLKILTQGGGREPTRTDHRHEAIETLADIAKNGTPGARVSAAVAQLDRAYGKPPQFNTGDATSFRKAVDLSDDELAAIVSSPSLP